MDKIVLFGRVSSDRINNITGLRNKRIGIVKNHFISTSYQKLYPDLNYVEFETNREVLSALALNEVDVYPYEITPTKFSITQNNIQGVEVIGDEFIIENSEIDQRMAVHKNNPILLSIINKSMASVTDEEFAVISDKWIVRAETNENIGLTPEEQAWLSENRVIKVGVDPTVAPSEAIDENGNISGIAGDYLDIIAKKLNVKFEWAGSRNWTEALSMVQSGEADILSAAASTRARREYLLFTDIYLNKPNVIFTRSGGQVFGNIESLSGYKVAQISDFSITEFLRTNHPDITITEVTSAEEAVEKVSSGQADAYISTISSGVAAITKAGVTNVIVSGNASSYKAGDAIATRMELPLLASALQKALTSIVSRQNKLD